MTTTRPILPRITLGLATFGLVGVLGASPVHAGGPGHGDKPGFKVDRMCQELTCSDAQRVKIQEIEAADAPRLKTEHEAIRALRDQLRAEFARPSPDARAIERLDDQIAARQATIRKARRAAELKILALLTPAQKAKFVEQLDRRGGKHGERKAK